MRSDRGTGSVGLALLMCAAACGDHSPNSTGLPSTVGMPGSVGDDGQGMTGSDTGGEMGTGGGTAPGSTGGDSDAGSGSTPGEMGGGNPSAACDSWLITYDLDGSTYRIDANMDAGDNTFMVEPDYAAGDKVGPGTFVLRFSGDATAPGEGAVQVVSYEMTTNFSILISNTALDTTAGTANEQNSVGACGVANGQLAGSEVTWTTLDGVSPEAHMQEVRTAGEISCDAVFGCDFVPVGTRDDTGTQALPTFTMNADLSGFTTSEFMAGMDTDGSTHITYVGTETSRVCEVRPSC